jgi:carbamoyltransferase
MLPEEDAGAYFQCDQRYPPLYTMQLVVPVVETCRGRIPAAVHVDGTARPQLVARNRDPLTHALLREFERQAGVPVLINTSFNLAGDPIVCTPLDAYKTFLYSELDLLVVGRCLCAKTDPTGA